MPRPETETVVEAALAAIEARGARTQTLRIADLGTGSGAILLALLSELPNAFGVGSDVSPAALLVARDNARRLGLTRAHFVACDMAAALRGPFDVIVCNPPYIASREIAALAPEVRDFDPRGALDGGPDGLDFYRAIAASAPGLALRPKACWSLNWEPARRNLSPHSLPPQGLHHRRHAPILWTCRERWSPKGHEREALDPGKKALGISRGTD